MVDAKIARTLLSLAVVVAIVPVRSYQLLGAEQPLPLGYEPVAPGQAPAPQDTPEVARARAEHLAAVERAVSRTRTSAGAVVPLTLNAPAWSLGYGAAAPWAGAQQANGPVDTFEAAAGNAKHLASVQAATRRLSPDLPVPVQDTPEVAAARAEHLAAVAAAEARNAAEVRNSGIASTESTPTQYASPQLLTKVHASHFAHAGFLRPQNRYYTNPVAVAQTVVPTYQPPSQYLAPIPVSQGGYYNNIGDDDGQYRGDDEGQYRGDDEGQYRGDDEGQYRGNDEPSSGEYSYSYNDGLSSKSETRTADGITRGSYSYYDANGVLQTLSYEADDVNGFRVYGSNLPQVSPAAAAALGNPDDPAAAVAAASAGAVQDTPEVAAAKQAHLAAYREALQRLETENH